MTLQNLFSHDHRYKESDESGHNYATASTVQTPLLDHVHTLSSKSINITGDVAAILANTSTDAAAAAAVVTRFIFFIHPHFILHYLQSINLNDSRSKTKTRYWLKLPQSYLSPVTRSIIAQVKAVPQWRKLFASICLSFASHSFHSFCHSSDPLFDCRCWLKSKADNKLD